MTPAEGIRADVIVVGAGAASLAAAYSIASHCRKKVIVLEKGRGVGSHSISGAIIRPGILERLLGGRRLPFGTPVAEDKVALLTERRYLGLPAPPPIRSKGCLMVCYGRRSVWIFRGFPPLARRPFPADGGLPDRLWG